MNIRGVPLLLLATLLLAGCHRQAEVTATRADRQIAGDVQAKLEAESALSGQKIQVAVNNAVVTLSGTASDAASRALAGNDAGSVSGVRTVVNNLEVDPAQTAAAVAPVPTLSDRPKEASRRRPRHEQLASAELAPAPDQPAPAEPLPVAAPAAPPPALTSASLPAAPAPPVEKTVVLDAGTVISVRMVEPLDSATAQADQGFHATLAADLISGDRIAIPQGTSLLGRVVDARDAAHFKGSSLLSIELTRIDLHGSHIAVVTDTYSKQGAGRGKDTGEKVGGGAVLGTLIGAIAGGGKGAAIGAVAGAGAGTGVSAATRGQQVQIPSETLISFRLQSPITITTARAVGSPPPPTTQPDEPVLHQPPAQ